jgi:hypothetical protein
MHARRLRQAILTIAQIFTLLASLEALATAQAQNPAPPPAAPGGRTFSENLAAVANRATLLLPVIQNEVEGPLLPWLETFAWGLAALVIFGAFAKLWRENAGAGVDLFWWFARLGVIFALMGSGPLLIDRMAEIGQRLAFGEDGGAVLGKFYVQQRNNFNYAYVKFSEGLFTVKGTPVEPVPGGVLGVIFSTESSMRDATRKLDMISRDMSLLYDGLNLTRGVISFGDFFLTMLGSFLLIAVRLAAPIMIALAIDRSIAQRVTYPYIWGVVVLTLIWPIVALIIKSIAYLGRNIAMALGDNQRFYQFDQATMQIIHSSTQHPVYTVLFAAVIMLIAGLSLWGSPYIAYQLSVGRVYEGISTTISSWAGQVVGAGIEYYSASMAASITRQAEILQAQGGYQAEVTRAGAGQEAGNLQARASRIVGITGAQASRESALASIEGGRVRETKGIEAERKYGQEALEAQTNLEKSNIGTRKDLSVADQNASQHRERKNIETDRSADTEQFAGRKIQSGSEWLSRILRGSGNSGVRNTGGALELIGGGYGLYKQWSSIQNRAAGREKALGEYTGAVNKNQGDAADRFGKAQDAYRDNMGIATNQRAGDLTGAANAGAAISAAGAQRGYNIAVGGYNQAYNLNCTTQKEVTKWERQPENVKRDHKTFPQTMKSRLHWSRHQIMTCSMKSFGGD